MEMRDWSYFDRPHLEDFLSVIDMSTSAGGGPEDSQLDRVPPSDVIAEQSVLGGMLLSKDAIADVV